MLLAAADQRLGLTAALAACLHDPRDPSQIWHQLATLLGQRVYQIACGYEDCNEADDLRSDLAFKTALGRRPKRDRNLASQPTLSRFENCVSRTSLRRLAEVFVDQFVARYATDQPCRIVLDFDATDDETHGQQQFTAFHGHYREHCYLPLLVTAQVADGPQELLVAMLRPGSDSAAKHTIAVLKRLVEHLQQAGLDGGGCLLSELPSQLTGRFRMPNQGCFGRRANQGATGGEQLDQLSVRPRARRQRTQESTQVRLEYLLCQETDDKLGGHLVR